MGNRINKVKSESRELEKMPSNFNKHENIVIQDAKVIEGSYMI